jgi:hypothetical protein
MGRYHNFMRFLDLCIFDPYFLLTSGFYAYGRWCKRNYDPQGTQIPRWKGNACIFTGIGLLPRSFIFQTWYGT